MSQDNSAVFCKLTHTAACTGRDMIPIIHTTQHQHSVDVNTTSKSTQTQHTFNTKPTQHQHKINTKSTQNQNQHKIKINLKTSVSRTRGNQIPWAARFSRRPAANYIAALQPRMSQQGAWGAVSAVPCGKVAGDAKLRVTHRNVTGNAKSRATKRS